MKTTVDAMIVGAGIPGRLVALGFAYQGWRVALCEARPTLATGNDLLFALHAPACDLLRELGVWERLATPLKVRHMLVHASAGCEKAVDSATANRDSLCHMVEENELLAALQDAVARSAITVHLDAPIRSLDTSGGVATVIYGDTTVTASIVVGADGANSAVATLAGLPGSFEQLPYSAVVARLRLPQLGKVARQWMGPDGVLALLPGHDGCACLIWSVMHTHAKKLQALPVNEFMHELRNRCGRVLDAAHPPVVRHVVPLCDHVRDMSAQQRVALVGDSAHAFHPLAGQGLSVGLGDVACLLRVHEDRELGCARALGDYRRLRAMRVRVTLALTSTIARWAETPSAKAQMLGMGLAVSSGHRLAWLANSP